ncbi:DMT family transporter [Actinoalloteichus spitiensis]|uniref:DMT family transporter n=1 Tax=Actinoalloteichus spitiensis TaxID=252394 RepID=UPI000365EB67|nr:DMT family transporter [Actinoalloteichus spitiensis]
MSKQIGIPREGSTLVTAGLGTLFVLCWSSGFIGAKLGASDAPVPTVLMWRFVPLAAVLAPFLLPRSDKRGTSRPGDLGRQVTIGALSQSGYLLTVYWAIGLGVSTGTTALIDGMQPLVVAALVGPLLGAAVTGRQWSGLGLGFAGVVLVTWSDATAPGNDVPAWAYLVPFAGMLCLVAATFLERRATTSTPPMRALAVHCATSAVVFSAIALATGSAAPPTSGQFWIAMSWLVVLSTFGGYGLYWYLLRRVGVTRVNTLMFLVPPVTTLWGGLMFDEPLTAGTAVGLTLALAATWAVTRASGESAPRSARGNRPEDGATPGPPPPLEATSSDQHRAGS